MSTHTLTPSVAEPVAQHERTGDSHRRAELLLDEALAETFPCSDPVSSLSFDTPADYEKS